MAYFVAAIGPTGGLQLAITSTAVPSNYVVPVHAWISASSAIFRTIGLRSFIDLKFLLRFVIPSMLATSIAVYIGEITGFAYIKILIGVYILSDVLTKKFSLFQFKLPNIKSAEIAGLVTGFVTAFIGASGPLLWSLIKNKYSNKECLSATHSACLVVQHFSKIILFGIFGVSILKYWPLLVSTVIASALGTYLGQKKLLSLSEKTYRTLLDVALIVSALIIISLGVEDVTS